MEGKSLVQLGTKQQFINILAVKYTCKLTNLQTCKAVQGCKLTNLQTCKAVQTYKLRNNMLLSLVAPEGAGGYIYTAYCIAYCIAYCTARCITQN